MSFRLPIFAVTLALFGALSARPASAQIYAWRDANGTLVLSDRKIGANARTYEVPNSAGFRSTRPLTSLADRSQYEPLIQQYASQYSIAPDLVRAVIQVESGF